MARIDKILLLMHNLRAVLPDIAYLNKKNYMTPYTG